MREKLFKILFPEKDKLIKLQQERLINIENRVNHLIVTRSVWYNSDEFKYAIDSSINKLVDVLINCPKEVKTIFSAPKKV